MKSRGLWCVALAAVFSSVIGFGPATAQPPDSLETAFEAVETASLERAIANRVLSEKTIAVTTANSTATVVAEAARKAAEARVAAERIGAAEALAVAEKTAAELDRQAKAVKAVVENANKDRAAAAKLFQSKTEALNAANKQLAAARAAAEKTAAEVGKSAGEAIAARDAAAKAVAQKSTSANQAANALAAAEAAFAKAEAERLASAKALAERVKTATSAVEAANSAQTTAESAAAERSAAEKALSQRTAVANAAQNAADREKDPAKKKTLAESATKAAAERAAAEKMLGLRTALARSATQKAVDAKSAVQKAGAERAAAERTLTQRTSAVKTAGEKLAAAKAAADKARTEKQSAETDLIAKIATERRARHQAVAARAIAEGGLKVIPESAWDYAKARHLLVRAGFGGTPEQVNQLHQMGLVEAVESLVDFQYQPDAVIGFTIEPPERPLPGENRLSPQERNRLNQRRDAKRNRDFARLRQWWMQRMVESPRPLQEKLTLFWHGHFATEWQKVSRPHLMHLQNELFREHAAANFGGLLYGIAHDPAMIVYLDNQTNYKSRPNQNLAREIMELFSLGVNQGYTEYDIREGARALTGYTYDQYTGQFRFNYAQHDTDAKVLFGQTGTFTGDDFCGLILQQPHTARFIGKKLFEFFAYSEPDPRVVTHLATVLRGNQYELAPMLKNLFMSEEFYGERAMGTQIKSPVQLVVGALRDLGIKGADYNTLVQWCGDMGQELFQPPNVKGWYGGRDWVNANLIFRRYRNVANLIQSLPLAENQRGIDLVSLLESKNCKSAPEIVELLARTCLVVPLNDEQRRELTESLGELPPADRWSQQRDQLNATFRKLLVLMMTTPQSQMT